MSDWKSKLPDFKEMMAMTTKLAKDIKTSVCEIIDDYKQKHPDEPKESTEVPKETKPTPKSETRMDDKVDTQTKVDKSKDENHR